MEDVLFELRFFQLFEKVCILVLKRFVLPFEIFEFLVELKIIFSHEGNLFVEFFIFGFGLFKFLFGIVFVILQEFDFLKLKEELLILFLEVFGMILSECQLLKDLIVGGLEFLLFGFKFG